MRRLVDRQSAESMVKILGIIYIVWGGLSALFGLMFVMGAGFMFGVIPGMGSLEGSVLAGIGVFVLMIAAVTVWIGVSVMSYRPWSRVAAIVIGVLSLFSFPVGTAIGVFAIWLLGFEQNAIALFTGTPPSAQGPPSAPPSY